jgi:uncharacterized protein YodC (DUF2158 family)
MQFRVGDIVHLRYGASPRMTVEKVTTANGNTWITCVWGEQKECHNYFAAEMLQRPQESAPPERPGVLASLWDRLAFWR